MLIYMMINLFNWAEICVAFPYGNDICIVNAFFLNHAHAPAVETFTANGTDSTRETGWEF